jgi:hypothetical protein
MWQRLLSLGIVIVFLILTYQTRGGAWLLPTGGYYLFVLACIWFAEEMGNFVGGAGPLKTSRSSAGMVRFMGWILLLFPIILFPLFYRACLHTA